MIECLGKIQKDTVHVLWTSMPLLAMKSFDEFIYSSKERTLSSWLSSIKALLGLFFCMWGGVGLALKLSSIRSTLGSIFYFSIGAYIIVSSSVRVRNYLRQIVIRALPPGSRAILFEKYVFLLVSPRRTVCGIFVIYHALKCHPNEFESLRLISHHLCQVTS